MPADDPIQSAARRLHEIESGFGNGSYKKVGWLSSVFCPQGLKHFWHIEKNLFPPREIASIAED